MKKLSPTRFKKWYTGSILILLFIFVIGSIAGTILLTTSEHHKVLAIILGSLGILSFIIATIIIARYRKRMMGIYQEEMDERFNQQLKTEEKLMLTWYLKKDDDLLSEGQELIMKKDFMVLNDESIHWNRVSKCYTKQDEHGWHMAILFDDQREVLLPLYDLIIRLVVHYSGLTLDDQAFQDDQKNLQTFQQSFIIWGLNVKLVFIKIFYIFVSLALGVGIGLTIGFIFSSEDVALAIGTTIANLIAIPMILIGYPKYFKDTQKYTYMLNQFAIGYAKGKLYMVVPFKIMESMSYDEHRLYLNLVQRDDDGHPIILYIPRDRYLMERLTHHLEEYRIEKDIIHL